jgi:hypothetical protein
MDWIAPYLRTAFEALRAWLVNCFQKRRWVRAEVVAVQLGICTQTVHAWGQEGHFPRRRAASGAWLYELNAAVAVWEARHAED